MPVLQRKTDWWNVTTPTGDTVYDDTLLDINYVLEVDGLLAGKFTRLTGGEMSIGVIQHNVTYETGDSTTLLIPGPISFAPIVLWRGFGFSEQLYRWLDASVKGDTIQARRNASITLNQMRTTTNDDGSSASAYEAVVRWNLTKCWLAKISGFEMNQYVDAALASLQITLVAESIERVEP